MSKFQKPIDNSHENEYNINDNVVVNDNASDDNGFDFFKFQLKRKVKFQDGYNSRARKIAS